jgi:hypothetical protein
MNPLPPQSTINSFNKLSLYLHSYGTTRFPPPSHFFYRNFGEWKEIFGDMPVVDHVHMGAVTGDLIHAGLDISEPVLVHAYALLEHIAKNAELMPVPARTFFSLPNRRLALFVLMLTAWNNVYAHRQLVIAAVMQDFGYDAQATLGMFNAIMNMTAGFRVRQMLNPC